MHAHAHTHQFEAAHARARTHTLRNTQAQAQTQTRALTHTVSAHTRGHTDARARARARAHSGAHAHTRAQARVHAAHARTSRIQQQRGLADGSFSTASPRKPTGRHGRRRASESDAAPDTARFAGRPPSAPDRGSTKVQGPGSACPGQASGQGHAAQVAAGVDGRRGRGTAGHGQAGAVRRGGPECPLAPARARWQRSGQRPVLRGPPRRASAAALDASHGTVTRQCRDSAVARATAPWTRGRTPNVWRWPCLRPVRMGRAAPRRRRGPDRDRAWWARTEGGGIRREREAPSREAPTLWQPACCGGQCCAVPQNRVGPGRWP